MGYKEKYEGMLDKLNTLLDDCKKRGQIIARIKDIESIFPELKESEDEKIRKALLEMVHDTTGDELWVNYNIHKEECIAWLEKQGEQKPAEWSEEDKRNFELVIDYVYTFYPDPVQKHKLTTWLKSLWIERLTKEQLDALKYAHQNTNPSLSDES